MNEAIKELNDEELIFILKNDNIRIEKEDRIWEIIKERIKNNRNKSILLGTIKANYLNKEYFKEFIETIEEEDIKQEPKILNIFKEILMKNIDNIQLKEKKTKRDIITITHEQGNNFNGIFKYYDYKKIVFLINNLK